MIFAISGNLLVYITLKAKRLDHSLLQVLCIDIFNPD